MAGGEVQVLGSFGDTVSHLLDLLALEFSDLFRLAENACAHRYRKQKFDARGNRTHNLAIWSRKRYQMRHHVKIYL